MIVQKYTFIWYDTGGFDDWAKSDPLNYGYENKHNL